MKGRQSAFSVLLIMVAMSFVGLACLPMLNIQYKPTSSGRTITVSFSYPGASPETVEAEVTSKMEGALSGLPGNTGVSSVSRNGSGRVSVSFGKKADMKVARLETTSAVRSIYPHLPSGVSYPAISHDAEGNTGEIALSYLIKGNLPSSEIEKYAREHIIPRLAAVEGIDDVGLYGATSYHWVLTYDVSKTLSAGISSADIRDALRAHYDVGFVGMAEVETGVMSVCLSAGGDKDFGSVPVACVGGRIVYLRDIASWRYQEALPDSYYRVNGLNTITLTVGLALDVNLLTVSEKVRNAMYNIQNAFPEELTADMVYDASEYVSEELDKIYMRTGLCLLVLLLFVFVVYRSWRYMFVVAVALVVNLLIALAIYALAGISVHIYTLAGITVSLGIMIDSSIIMIDHYSRFGDRKAFPSLLAAVCTTVSALMVVLLLPEREKANLTDFIWVTALNLTVSLFVSYLFIPALMSYLPPLGNCKKVVSWKMFRRRVRLRCCYSRYITWGVRHKWVYVAAFVVVFGVPLCVLPDASTMEKKERNVFQEILYRIVSWPPYAENRQVVDKVAGTSFAAFHRALGRSDFYREPEKKMLYIKAGMLEGCTVHQLNEVVKFMENYLAGFEEIETFTTSVHSYSNAEISVKFRPEFENTGFPAQLKSSVTSMAINYGGANWSVYGIDEQGFSNNVISNHKSHRITLYGYNYRELRGYAVDLIDYLSLNRRVSGPEIWGAGWNGRPKTEFHLEYDFERMAVAGISPQAYYSALLSRLYERPVGVLNIDGGSKEVVLKSSEIETFDLWNVLNTPLRIDSLAVALSDIGSIEKGLTDMDIHKKRQSYEINVCYDFAGSYELARKATAAAVDYMNEEVLPVGYKAENPYGGWFDRHKDRYAWLIFLIITVIYVMLSVTFESLRLPLAVILMIPVSFIGLFLTFGLSDLSFDQGGFAALVMLSGIAVNAGIYILLPFRRSLCRDIRSYMKAFGLKIVPIMLTVISTVLGLIPFLTDGPEEVFWFDFAVGTISGMLFSVIALVLILPVFAIKKTDI